MISIVHEKDRQFLVWDERKVDGLTLIGGKAKASISIYGGSEGYYVTGGASKCSQKQFDAYEMAKNVIRKSLVTRKDPEKDILSILESGDWEVYPK